MSARNYMSSFPLKHMIIFYFILQSNNCSASLSIMTEKSEDKNSVKDVPQNVIMRQLSLISDGMSKTNTDMKNDISMIKKALVQTQTDLLILKEENKNLREQLSKSKVEINNNKASIDKTRTRQDTIITNINSYTKEFKELNGNETQELTIRLEKQENLVVAQNKRLLEQGKVIQTLKNIISEVKENDKSKTRQLKRRWKDQDYIHITLAKLRGHLKELENFKLKTDTCRDILRYRCDIRSFTCKSGVYSIYVKGKITQVWCDMETDGGGWTVIQRRQNGNVDFFRTWKEYKVGFGNVSDEYWIGNDALHVLTSSRKMKLRVDLEQFNGTKGHATFSTFAVAIEANKYRLSLSGYTGDKRINDCFSHNNGKQFSTKDRDNDLTDIDCAVYKHGGWWYGLCTDTNLNGQYYTSAAWSNTGVSCWHWAGNTQTSLKSSRMMIR